MVELSSAGEIRFAESFQKAYAGDALNTAIAARRLGSNVAFLTGIADDPFAFGLQQIFLIEGIETKYMRKIPGSYTGLYFVAQNMEGEREFQYYRKGSAASFITEKDITEDLIRSAKLVFSTGVTLGLSESMRAAVYKAFRLARENKVMTVFDPNYRSRLWPNRVQAMEAMDKLLSNVDVILPTVPDDTLPTIGLSRVDQVVDYFWYKGIPLVVTKMGAQGCYVAYRQKGELVPAMKVDRVVETTGAGDTFNGAFIHGLINNCSIMDCARLAVTAAGLKVQREGIISALPNREAVYSRAFSVPVT